MTVENNKDRIAPLSFHESLKRLSDSENPIPLVAAEINLPDLRNQLAYAGINFAVLERDPKFQEIIKKPQFHNFDSGRGPAVAVAFGEVQSKTYADWANIESVDQPRLTHGDDSSKSRGLMQFAADVLALASKNITPEDFIRKTNWRVGKKYKDNPELAAAFGLPAQNDVEGQKKLRETSSIPIGSAVKAYDRILTLNKNS